VSTIEAGAPLAADGGGRPGWWKTLWVLLGTGLLAVFTVVLPLVAVINWLGLPDGDESGTLSLALSGESAGTILAKLGLASIVVAGASCWLSSFELFRRVPWPVLTLALVAGSVPAIFLRSEPWILTTLVAIRYLAFARDGSPRRVPFSYPKGIVAAGVAVALGLVPLAARGLTHSVTADQIFAPSKYEKNVLFPLENHGAARAEVTLPDGRIVLLHPHSGTQQFLVPAAKLPCGERLSGYPLRYHVFGHTGTIVAKFTGPAFVPCR
jgi:hypothetical protein